MNEKEMDYINVDVRKMGCEKWPRATHVPSDGVWHCISSAEPLSAVPGEPVNCADKMRGSRGSSNDSDKRTVSR